MSRWTDAFNTHPFQAVWLNLKNTLDEASVDDETVLTSVSELVRLKKVIVYLDGMIEVVDAEMLPLTTWDTFNSQAGLCVQQVNNFNSNRNIAHITQANAHADNLLTYLRPYMVLPKEAAASIKRAATTYSKTADEYVKSVQEKSSELFGEMRANKVLAEDLVDSITSSKNKVDNYVEDVFQDGGIKETMDNFAESTSAKHDEVGDNYDAIKELHNELLIGGSDALSIKAEILSVKEAINDTSTEIKKAIKSVNKEVGELEDFHSYIFGEDDEDGEKKGGLPEELEVRTNELTEFEEQQKIKYEALINQIEDVLPGATSAGLASAYRGLRKSFSQPIKIKRVRLD